MLRHTFATRCIENGMSTVVLQKILGHKDIETTLNTYTSVFNKFKQDEIVKINDYFNTFKNQILMQFLMQRERKVIKKYKNEIKLNFIKVNFLLISIYFENSK